MQTETRIGSGLDLANMTATVSLSTADSVAEMSGAEPRQGNRLPERILAAAHKACDLGDLDVAAQLLSVLEAVVPKRGGVRPDPAHRRVIEGFIATHHRLWHLRHASVTIQPAARSAPSNLSDAWESRLALLEKVVATTIHAENRLVGQYSRQPATAHTLYSPGLHL